MFLEDKSRDYHDLPTSISYNTTEHTTTEKKQPNLNKYVVKYVENFIRTFTGCR